jgi:hypothetical protein
MEKSLTAAFNSYFGKKSGQLMSDFSKEIRSATENPNDRKFWVEQFETHAGYKIIDAVPAVVS